MNKGRRCLFAFVVSMLTWAAGCTTGSPQDDNQPVLPSADKVTSHCLARAASGSEPRPAIDQLNSVQWHSYVACALASNLLVATASVPENPEGIVSIRLDPLGAVSSVTLLHSSGNPAWDAAIQRAIVAASPLPPVRAPHGFSRVEIHFRPQRQALGIGGSTGLTGESHWSVHHCNSVGGATACD